jgi:hypothetical protein
MGNIASSHIVAISPVVVGFVYVSSRSLQTARRLGVPTLPIAASPRGPDSSFISLQSDEQSELDTEIERAALFIKSIKELIEVTIGDEESASPVVSRKRQLEQTLTRAESSFNSLFELKTKLEQFETDGLTLGSRITSEIAKSVATRDIDTQLVVSIAKSNSMIGGDMSPFKRQRTTT